MTQRADLTLLDFPLRLAIGQALDNRNRVALYITSVYQVVLQILRLHPKLGSSTFRMVFFFRRKASLALTEWIKDALMEAIFLTCLFTSGSALHHMKRAPIAYVSQRDESVPLAAKNLCAETIYPGIVTQSGTGPASGGFGLRTGESKSLTVSADWQGRVWGRTNCSFNGDGTGPSNNGGYNGGGVACGTGDCGGIIDCRATVGREVFK